VPFVPFWIPIGVAARAAHRTFYVGGVGGLAGGSGGLSEREGS
jgi:hypothetical protein